MIKRYSLIYFLSGAMLWAFPVDEIFTEKIVPFLNINELVNTSQLSNTNNIAKSTRAVLGLANSMIHEGKYFLEEKSEFNKEPLHTNNTLNNTIQLLAECIDRKKLSADAQKNNVFFLIGLLRYLSSNSYWENFSQEAIKAICLLCKKSSKFSIRYLYELKMLHPHVRIRVSSADQSLFKGANCDQIYELLIDYAKKIDVVYTNPRPPTEDLKMNEVYFGKAQLGPFIGDTISKIEDKTKIITVIAKIQDEDSKEAAIIGYITGGTNPSMFKYESQIDMKNLSTILGFNSLKKYLDDLKDASEKYPKVKSSLDDLISKVGRGRFEEVLARQ